jgi:large subunit ribosomal protein L28
MPRCELTQKGPVVSNLVSHSNIKTKSISQPNIQYKKLHSQALNRAFTLKIATSTLRTIEHRGGFDGFILNQPTEKLSRKAQEIRNKIKQKLHSKKSKAKKA